MIGRSASIEGVVFDLWNTLAHSEGTPPPMRLLAEAAGIAGDPDWARRIERGMMLAPADGMEGALRQLRARAGLEVGDAAQRARLVERWSAVATLFADARPALERLHGHFRLGLCSNTQSFGLEILDREGVWALLDASALSFEVGALKPHPRIFHTLCRRLALPPDKLLMVGDRADDDVDGARRAGMHAVRIDREGGGETGTIADLRELPAWIDRLNDRG